MRPKATGPVAFVVLVASSLGQLWRALRDIAGPAADVCAAFAQPTPAPCSGSHYLYLVIGALLAIVLVLVVALLCVSRPATVVPVNFVPEASTGPTRLLPHRETFSSWVDEPAPAPRRALSHLAVDASWYA